MKRILAPGMGIYIGIAAPVLCVVPIFLLIFVIKNETVGNIIPIIIFSVLGFIVLCAYYISVMDQLYSYGIFNKDRVIVKCPLRKTYVIEYKDIKDVEIGYYFHGAYNTSLGSKVKYIYFAKRKLSEEQKSNLNLLKPSKSFIKIGYNQKTYNYLIDILPDELSDMLKESYEELKAKKILK